MGKEKKIPSHLLIKDFDNRANKEITSKLKEMLSIKSSNLKYEISYITFDNGSENLDGYIYTFECALHDIEYRSNGDNILIPHIKINIDLYLSDKDLSEKITDDEIYNLKQDLMSEVDDLRDKVCRAGFKVSLNSMMGNHFELQERAVDVIISSIKKEMSDE